MKFTIRDLFLVTVITALVLGWWVDKSRLTREIGIIRGRHAYKRAMAEVAKMIADGEKDGAESKAALAREIDASRGQSGGPVRGYELLTPALPDSQAPAPIPPENQPATNAGP